MSDEPVTRRPPQRHAALPWNMAPIGLSRAEAAAYIGVSVSTFSDMMADGRMPQPRCIGSRRVWSRFEVEAAFAELPGDGTPDDEAWARA